MGIFAGSVGKLKAARSAGGARNHFQPGVHQAKISSLKGAKSRKDIAYFAVNSTIIATTSDDPRMAVGQSVDWSAHADSDYYWGNIKQFITALLDCTEAELNAVPDEDLETLLEAMISDSQPYCDYVVESKVVEVIAKQGKNVGKPYNAVEWRAADRGLWSPEQLESKQQEEATA